MIEIALRGEDIPKKDFITVPNNFSSLIKYYQVIFNHFSSDYGAYYKDGFVTLPENGVYKITYQVAIHSSNHTGSYQYRACMYSMQGEENYTMCHRRMSGKYDTESTNTMWETEFEVDITGEGRNRLALGVYALDSFLYTGRILENSVVYIEKVRELENIPENYCPQGFNLDVFHTMPYKCIYSFKLHLYRHKVTSAETGITDLFVVSQSYTNIRRVFQKEINAGYDEYIVVNVSCIAYKGETIHTYLNPDILGMVLRETHIEEVNFKKIGDGSSLRTKLNKKGSQRRKR